MQPIQATLPDQLRTLRHEAGREPQAAPPRRALKTPPSAKVASGRSGSTPSPEAGAPSSPEVQRLHAIERLLALFYLAYDREPPEGAERVAKVGVWTQALQDVPVAQIVPLAHAELRERESAFFPAPADLLRRFNEGAQFSPEGATNTAAYLPYSPSNARVLPASPDVPLQIEPQELKRRLGLVRDESAPTAPAIQADDLAEVGERWSAFLLDIARAGNIDLDLCSPAQIAELRAFGRWWLAHHPQRDLLTTGFGSAYEAFKASF